MGTQLPYLLDPQGLAVFPAFADGFLDVLVEAAVLEVHSLRIVFHYLARAESNSAEDNGFREWNGVVEVGSALIDFSFDGGDDFLDRVADRSR